MMDLCPKAIEEVKLLKQEYANIDKITRARMQDYIFEEEYNAIILRWSIGYLKDNEAILFLAKAQRHLRHNVRFHTRKFTPSSFIFVIDNVLFPDEDEEPQRGEI